MTDRVIRIVLADDHAVLRAGLRVLLNASGVRPKLVRVLEERGLLTLEAPAPATSGA